MNRDWAQLFRTQLARLRDSKGLTQPGLSEKIGRGQQYVGHIETGVHQPAFEMIFELAEGLDLSPMELFFVEGLDDNKEELRRRIDTFLDRCDEEHLRRIYRLMLVSFEKVGPLPQVGQDSKPSSASVESDKSGKPPNR
jgi:transcriptional regulator with XRE-family HTH domain